VNGGAEIEAPEASNKALATLRHDTQIPTRKDSPATWDEFPNGRFGDARSPAYGDLDGWGISLKVSVSARTTFPPCARL
jgi:methylenetetrahydrofolate reductase (NADPH)